MANFVSHRNGTYSRKPASDARQYGKRAATPKGDFDRLFEAMRFSRRTLERFRVERMAAVKQYVGGHYADGGSEHNNPIGLLARYVQVTARSLVPKCPRVMLSTMTRSAQPAVSAMQDWTNVWLPRVYFGVTAQRCVIDALFSVGIMKVALGTPADTAAHHYAARTGEPFAECLDLDDFVFDSGTRDFSCASFIGHRFRISREVAEDLSYFDPKARKDLSGAVSPYGLVTNQEGDERIDVIGRGWYGGDTRDYREMVDLWEVYDPQARRVYTFASDSGGVPSAGAKPLRDQPWLGPDCGPYHFLSLGLVPGNAMPKGPALGLVDLDRYVNSLYRKLTDQAMRQKTVLPARGAAVDDAGALIQASDGEVFSCDNADTLKEVSFGGPSQVNALFATHLSDVFNRMAGNLDVQSGAAPQSKTATQDKLLNENATAGVADMQDATINFLSGTLNSVAWYLWYHPKLTMPSTRKISGLPDMDFDRVLHPAGATRSDGTPETLRREGSFEQLQVRCDPYSLVYKSPGQRLAFLMGLIEKFLPAQQVLAAQSIRLDLQAAVKLIAKYADEPEVETLFTVADVPQQPKVGGDGGGMGMPASTSREYTRRSVGNDTEASRYSELANSGMSEASQQQ